MKTQRRPNTAQTRAKKQEAILDLLNALNNEALPERDSSFNVYVNGNLIASASPPNEIENIKTNNNENKGKPLPEPRV